MARGRALAHPVPARQTDLAIQLHGMNLPTLPVTGKGSQTGRVLLRRNGTVPPLPWSTFAPPLTTLKKIYEEKEYMDVLGKFTPDFFMFGGGGNDLQEGLAYHEYMHEYDPARKHGDYLTANGIDGIREIGIMYEKILRDVAASFPNMRILCHGYDYPRPLVDDGKYIGRYLRGLNIPDEAMSSILIHVVDLLNTTIQNTIGTIANIEYKNS